MMFYSHHMRFSISCGFHVRLITVGDKDGSGEISKEEFIKINLETAKHVSDKQYKDSALKLLVKHTGNAFVHTTNIFCKRIPDLTCARAHTHTHALQKETNFLLIHMCASACILITACTLATSVTIYNLIHCMCIRFKPVRWTRRTNQNNKIKIV